MMKQRSNEKRSNVGTITISNSIPGKSNNVGMCFYGFISIMHVYLQIMGIDIDIKGSIITKITMKNRLKDHFEIFPDISQNTVNPMFVFKMFFKGNIGYIGNISFVPKNGVVTTEEILRAYEICKQNNWQHQ